MKKAAQPGVKKDERRMMHKGRILAWTALWMLSAAQAAQDPAAALLLAQVRQAVREDPSLADSRGDRALLAAMRRVAEQQPHMADSSAEVARSLKPHLVKEIDATLRSGEERGNDLFALGLEELMNTRVVTASKSKERAFDVPAAMTVITNEDIRRSGQTNVMEVLRMVPGMQVSRINSSGWVVSARGFADEYANKMLVLVDGRSIYTPTFSGTYWDLVNLPMEDIDRIEVIRGPGASVWGANAVNGVINIVTKESKYTQGAYVTAGAGSHERVFGEGRVGGKMGEDGHYRFYSRYLDRDRLEDPQGMEQNNGWQRMLTGARADWTNGGNDSFTVQGEVQQGNNEQETVQFGPVGEDAEMSMSYLRGRWGKVLEDGSVLTVNSFIDQNRRDTAVLDQRVTTFDVDVSHALRWADRNDLVWGGGYRLWSDSFNTTSVLSFIPHEEEKNLFSAFVQNTFEATERLDLTLGTKVEHNDFTGIEVQPTAKAAFRPDERSTIWASVARAVRSPSRSEDSIRYVVQEQPTAPPTLGVIMGDGGVDSEELIAYELGYRISPREGLVFDVSTYYNDYGSLTTLMQGTPFFDGSSVIVPLRIGNLGEAEMYGIEASASWQVTPGWLLAGYYSYGHLNTDAGAANQLTADYETLWPEHSFSLRSLYNFTENVEFDTAAYYVADLDNAREVDGSLQPIDAYLKWDMRLGWRPWEGIELSLVGLDLLDGGRQQFIDSRFYPASQIGRSYYGKVAWRF